MKRSKRYLALLLVFVMCFSTSISALADTPVSGDMDIQTIEGDTDEVIVDGDIPNEETVPDVGDVPQGTTEGQENDNNDTVESQFDVNLKTVQPEFQVNPVDNNFRFYKINISNYTMPADGQRMKVAVFKSDNENAVHWLEAKRDSENDKYVVELDMLDFSGIVGSYTIHAYYESVDGSNYFVGDHKFNITNPPVNTTVVSAGAVDSTEKSYKITIDNFYLVPDGELRVGVWNDAQGAGSARWNIAQKSGDNQYTVTVNVADYKAAGSFTAHVYFKKSDGSMQWIGGTSFTTTKASAGTIAITDQNYQKGTASVKIPDINSPSGINKVVVGIWSASNQSDMVWYDATKGNDGSYYIAMDVSKHKYNCADYKVHVYVTDGNDIQQFVGGSSIDFSMKYDDASVSLSSDNTKATIQVKNLQVPKGAKGVTSAIWSEAGGQDDLNWLDYSYDKASNTWKATVALSKFKSTGNYKVHIYVTKQDDSKEFLTGTSFDVAPPSVEDISVSTDNNSGKFTVKIVGASSAAGISSVRVPIWSEPNQGDIVWYDAVKQSDGSYMVESNISKHKYNVGKYNIHVYVKDDNGVMTNIGCKNCEFKYGMDGITLQNNSAQTIYPVTAKNVVVPMGVQKVEFAAWSEAGGQDDVHWYAASADGNGNYKANIDVKNHKTLGKYIIHVYATTKGGKKIYLGSNDQMVVNGTPKAKVTVTGRNDKEGTFTVVVSDVSAPSGVSGVRVAAWSTGNDTSWYTTTKQSDGTYKAVIKVLNHNYNLGNYTIHTYVTMGNQITSFGAGTTYKFMPSNFIYVLNDQGTGKRRVVLKNPSSTSNLRFGAWSDKNGQDDVVWYSANKNGDGSWQAVIESKNHKDSGNFSVHAYAGSYLNSTTFFFPASEFAKNGWFYENGYKLYYVNDVLQKDVSSIIGPQSQYMAKINRTTCTVTMYAKDGANGYIIPVKVFACSVGLPQTPTPTGTYSTSQKYRWHELMGPSYGQYCTRIVGGILFHSVAGYNYTSYNLPASEYNKLGQPASHGCVRLNVRDAKWIYDNCRLGMTVTIYDSSYPGPLGKPATIKIPASQNWDPTDPNI